jgi:hypothetical protein
MRRAREKLVHDGDMEPALERLRDAYRGDTDVPAHDDTVTRLFEQYIEAEAAAPSARRQAGLLRRIINALRKRR